MSRGRNLRLIAGLASVLFIASASVNAGVSQAKDASCSQDETKRTIKAFIGAFNRGDVDVLDRLWAQEPDFKWYFVDDERDQEDSEDRRTLRLYFQERVLLNDHLELRQLGVTPDGTDFAFKLLRTTDDERKRAAGVFHGKGATTESVPLPSLSQPFPTRTCLLSVWAMDNHRH